MGSIENKKYILKNGNEILIRNAVNDDAENIIEIKRSVVNEGVYMLRETDEAVYSTWKEIKVIEDHLHSNGSLYIVAESGNAIAGILEFQNGSLKRTSHAGMFTVYVAENFRNFGIGKFLINELIFWAEKNPVIEKITLNVFSTNLRAIHLYKKCGFIIEGICPKDMKLSDGTYIDSILMYKFVK
ncbi:MAG TPA: GNAT family N-acetyltransferase [Ignavibacteria bacterium]|nr:GNAT family N-acetyltransferase [Ignavibacteria bacterium]